MPVVELQSTLGGNHIASSRQACATRIGSELALSREPHHNDAGEKGQNDFGDEDCDPESWAMSTLDSEHEPVHQMANDTRQKDHKRVDYPLNQRKGHHVTVGHMAYLVPQHRFGFLAAHVLQQPSALRHQRIIKFMSAARAAARNKPVIVVKAGRAPEGARAAPSHTGALAGSYDIYEAAIGRAGMLRVDEIEDLFFAVETLARPLPLRGERMIIMTNGGGPGVMATDSLARRGGRIAALSSETQHRLDKVLPPLWSHGNPVDIIGDATVAHYVETLQVLLDELETDALLFIHAPSAIVPSEQIAAA